MSDQHAEHNGGHELEAVNAGALFRIIGGLAVIVGISCFVVIQWFYQQRNDLEFQSGTPYFLKQYWEQMDAEKAGLGDTAKEIANDAGMLAADPPPAGWVHPDDLKQGAG